MTPSIYTELSNLIISNTDFINDYNSLISYPFFKIFNQSFDMEFGTIKRLAESASILASSEDDQNKKLAFEILSTLYEQFNTDYTGIGSLSKIIFSRLGNFPAIDLLNPEMLDLSIPLEFESSILVRNNTVRFGEKELHLSNLQSESVKYLDDGYTLSISAPTSAGKSFLLTQFVANKLVTLDEFKVVIIVPTRALIRQLMSDFSKILFFEHKHLHFDDISIITSSVNEEISDHPKQLFILTQERLQSILSNWKHKPKIDLLVVDESQKISDTKRGIILEETINEMLEMYDNLQTIFLSPLAKNPEFLFSITNIPLKKSKHIHTSISPVAQQIYTIDIQGAKRGKVIINKILDKIIFPIGNFQLDNIPTSKAQRLALIVKTFSNKRSSIIYSNGPSEAEKNALELNKIFDKTLNDVEIKSVISSLKEFVHEEYYLHECLQKGVGYHYSSMPDIARISVEELFKKEKIFFIACTSTLLEGVNLPAKNIFLDRPKLGLQQMDDSSFWNLLGRAGRLMKDLSGNVFCVSPKNWDIPLSEREQEYSISSSLITIINQDNFVNYFSKSFDILFQEGYDSAFNNIYIKYKEFEKRKFNEFLTSRTSKEKTDEYILSLQEIDKVITLPSELLKMNKSIDFRLQEKFYQFLRGQEIESLIKLIPVQPFSDRFYRNLESILSNCDNFLSSHDRKTRFIYFTQLANKWVRENFLKEIIKTSLEYNKIKSDNKKQINETIRNLIKEINTDVRFHYVKLSKCYCDLLQFELSNRKFNIESISYVDFGLPNYLELGLCNKWSMELHNFGLSRTTSIIINNYAKRKKINTENIIDWVATNKKQLIKKIPFACATEIQNFFD